MSTAVADILERSVSEEIGIRPLQPMIGAEIEGVDLSRPLSDAQRDAIEAAILKWTQKPLPVPARADPDRRRTALR